MTTSQALQFVPFAVGALLLVGVIIAVRKQSTAVQQMMIGVAQAAGWSDLQASLFPRPTVRGTWQQFPVVLRFGPHQKNAPRRLSLEITAQTDHSIEIQRRFGGLFSNKPLTWFGAPLIDVHQPAAEPMWVRGDPQLAERLFADPKLGSLISTNMVTRFDRVKIDNSALRVTRSLQLPGSRLRFDLESADRVAREMIELAEAIVEKLR